MLGSNDVKINSSELCKSVGRKLMTGSLALILFLMWIIIDGMHVHNHLVNKKEKKKYTHMHGRH